MPAYAPLLKQLQQEVRQGNEGKARAIIEKLGKIKFQADPNEKYELSQSADFLIGKGKWDLAKLYLERLPQSEPGWGYILIKHMCTESNNDANKLDAVDYWIKARYPANPEYWWHLRITFAEETGRKHHVYADLAKEVKDNPQDLDRLKRFIQASSESAEKTNITWICKTVNPQLAYHNYRVAEWLHSKFPAEAIYYLQRAQSIPFTPQDDKEIKEFMLRYTAMVARPIAASKEFSVWVRTMLAECYQKNGQSKTAQELLLQLSKETGGKTPSYALTQLAGQIQASTPTHPLEQQIKRAEPKNEDSIEYWRGRADYYRGRGDRTKELDALTHALKLAKSKNDYSSTFYLPMVTNDYARFLRKNEGDKAALKFIWSEFDASTDLEYRTKLVSDLEQSYETDQTRYLSSTDERLWQLLKQKINWSFTEERILWRMARNASPQQRQTLWKRAERLAAGNASRELTLGWIMNRTEEPKRSIPILQAACKTSDADMKSRAQFTLFESYLDVQDWMHAEGIWPRASQRLTAEEKPDWLSRIALAAARCGDKVNSLRLWKLKDQVDLSAIQHLDDMVKLGMREQLINYYRAMKKAKPQSTVPDEALQKISCAGG